MNWTKDGSNNKRPLDSDSDKESQEVTPGQQTKILRQNNNKNPNSINKSMPFDLTQRDINLLDPLTDNTNQIIHNNHNKDSQILPNAQTIRQNT